MNVATLDTPAGPFTAVTDDEGAVLASGWTADADDLVPLIHPALRGDGMVRERPDLGAATTAARAYHQGDLDAIRGVPVVQRSGAPAVLTYRVAWHAEYARGKQLAELLKPLRPGAGGADVLGPSVT